MNSKNISETPSYNYFVTVLLLTIVGFIIRYHGLSEWAFSQDDIWHYHVANQKSLLEVFFVNFEIDGHPPLAYFIWYFLNNIFGFNEMAMRAPAMIAGLALIPAGYFLGKEIFKTKNAGLFFATFFAFSDMMFIQSQVVRGYTLSMLFIMLAMLSCFQFQKTKNSIHLFCYLIFAFLALMSEFAIAPLLVYTALGSLWVIYKSKNSKYIKFLIWVLVHIALLASIKFILFLTYLVGGLNILDSPLYKNSEYLLFFTRFIIETSLYNQKIYGEENSGFIFLTEFALLNVAFLLGVFSLLKKQNYIFLLCGLFYLAFIVIVSETGAIPADIPRRNIGLFLILISIFYLGIKFFIEKFKPEFIKFFYKKFLSIPIIILILSASILLITFNYTWRNFMTIEFYIKKSDVSKAINFLEKNVKKDDIVLSDWITSLFFRYYKNKNQPIKETTFSYNLDKLDDDLNFYFFSHPHLDARVDFNVFPVNLIKRTQDFNKIPFSNIYLFSIGSVYNQFYTISRDLFKKPNNYDINKELKYPIILKKEIKEVLKGTKVFSVNLGYCNIRNNGCEYSAVIKLVDRKKYNQIQNINRKPTN